MGEKIIKTCEKCGKEFIAPKIDTIEEPHNNYKEFTNNSPQIGSTPCSIESQMRASDAWKKIDGNNRNEKKYCLKCSIVMGIKNKF